MENISASAAYSDIESGKGVLLVDVRTPEEFSKGHIKGAVNIPLDLVEQEIELQILDKQTAMYVYCLSGGRSASAVEKMERMGYSNVKNMTSGLLAWRKEGFEVAL